MRWLFVLCVSGACGRVAFDASDLDAAGTAVDARPAGLLLRFSFAASAFLDETAKGRDGTCTSCPAPTAGPGPASEAAFFDGTNCVLVPATDLRPAAFTFAAWQRRDADRMTTIFGRPRDGETTIENSFEIYTNLGSPSVYVLASDSTLQLNTPASGWHHIVGVFTGSVLTTYIDGVMANEDVGIPPVAYGNDELRIGCDLDAGDERSYFYGAIDEVILFDRALTASEVAALAVP